MRIILIRFVGVFCELNIKGICHRLAYDGRLAYIVASLFFYSDYCRVLLDHLVSVAVFLGRGGADIFKGRSIKVGNT